MPITPPEAVVLQHWIGQFLPTSDPNICVIGHFTSHKGALVRYRKLGKTIVSD